MNLVSFPWLAAVAVLADTVLAVAALPLASVESAELAELAEPPEEIPACWEGRPG